MTEGPLVAVALSARPLAAALRRAGRDVLAIDLFDDTDTGDVALASRRVGGSFAEGPDLDETLGAIDALATKTRTIPAGIVVGAGFEHRPAALERLATRLPLLGTGAPGVARCKEPVGLAALLGRLGVLHPEVRAVPPADPAGWLAKEAGAAGGHHVRRAKGIGAAPGRYFQRRVDGAGLSAAFVADGRRARLLAFCETRVSPAPGAPYRFSGVVGPVTARRAITDGVAAALAALAPATGLRGLCGIDLVVDGDRWWLIEVNPRPTATLDVLDRGENPLMALHLAAMAGELPPAWRPPATPAGTAVVFAPKAVTIGAADWPEWVSDRPRPGTRIGRGEPIVTVRAEAETPASVVDMLRSREAEVLARVLG